MRFFSNFMNQKFSFSQFSISNLADYRSVSYLSFFLVSILPLSLLQAISNWVTLLLQSPWGIYKYIFVYTCWLWLNSETLSCWWPLSFSEHLSVIPMEKRKHPLIYVFTLPGYLFYASVLCTSLPYLNYLDFGIDWNEPVARAIEWKWKNRPCYKSTLNSVVLKLMKYQNRIVAENWMSCKADAYYAICLT